MSDRAFDGRKALPRRKLLRGLFRGGMITVGLPSLDSMLNMSGTAYAATGAPIDKCFGIYHWPHGVAEAANGSWVPAKTGAQDAWDLSPSLASLAPVKDYISVVSGTMITSSDHMSGPAELLNGAPYCQTSGSLSAGYGVPARQSIDQDVAQAFAKATPGQLASALVVGVCPDYMTMRGPCVSSISASGFNAPIPALYEPREVFKQIFGGGGAVPSIPTGEAGDKRRRRLASILDVVKQDMDTLKSKVGKSDQSRLEQHFEGIRAIERDLGAPPLVLNCNQPSEPASIGNKPYPAVNAGTNPDLNIQVSLQMARLVAMALACGRTRVFTFNFGNDTGGSDFNWLGGKWGAHGLGHAQLRANTDPADRAEAIMVGNKALLWTVEKSLSVFLKALLDQTDGATSLLHNCAVICASSMTNGSHLGLEPPLLVAGRAGGKLKTNLHVNYRKTTLAPNKGPFNDWSLYSTKTIRVNLTVMRALGINLPGYGVPAGWAPPPEVFKPGYILRGIPRAGARASDSYLQTESLTELLA